MNALKPPATATLSDIAAVVVDPMVVPAGGGAAVVKSDTTALTGVRALYIGTTGDVVATVGGTDLTFKNVPSGFILPIQATKVKAATTASDIVALS